MYTHIIIHNYIYIYIYKHTHTHLFRLRRPRQPDARRRHRDRLRVLRARLLRERGGGAGAAVGGSRQLRDQGLLHHGHHLRHRAGLPRRAAAAGLARRLPGLHRARRIYRLRRLPRLHGSRAPAHSVAGYLLRPKRGEVGQGRARKAVRPRLPMVGISTPDDLRACGGVPKLIPAPFN